MKKNILSSGVEMKSRVDTFVSSSLNVSDGPSASIEAVFDSSALVSFSGSNYSTGK